MATRTLKIGSKITIKDTGAKGVIEFIEDGGYVLKGCPVVYWSWQIIADKTAPEKKKNQRINQVSPIQKKLNAIYSILSREWMPHNKTCVARFPGCAIKSQEIHHMHSRAGFYLIMTKFFMPICRPCHRYATRHSKEAVAAGVSVPRSADIPYEFTKREKELMKMHDVNPPT